MKGKWMVAMVLFLCVCLVSEVILAQPAEDPGARRGERARTRGQRRGPGQGMMRGGGGMGGMFAGLELTKEQEEKMAKIRQETMEKMRGVDSPEARRELFTKMRGQIEDILTDDQRKKMREGFGGRGQGQRGGPAGERPTRLETPQSRRPRTMGPLDIFDTVARRMELSREQRTKIGKLRAEAIKKLMDDIGGVLTKDQKEMLAQAQKRYRDMQQNRGAQGPGARPGARLGRQREGSDEDRGEARERRGAGQRRERGGGRRERRGE